jgi:hypothetical protein
LKSGSFALSSGLVQSQLQLCFYPAGLFVCQVMSSPLTLCEAKDAVCKCKAPPGRVQGNECLKACRDKIRSVGQVVNVKHEMRWFYWKAYLANHKYADVILNSPVTDFFAEAFPEREPNGSKLVGQCQLRVDFVCTRVDGTSVRLHPNKAREAIPVENDLQEWRMGRRPVHALDRHAVAAAYGNMPPPPPPGTPPTPPPRVVITQGNTPPPPPPPGPPPVESTLHLPSPDNCLPSCADDLSPVDSASHIEGHIEPRCRCVVQPGRSKNRNKYSRKQIGTT